MKKSYLSVGLSTLLIASLLVGCGSSSSNTTKAASPNSVTVEDGPVIGATVKDAAGQVATENGSNVYSFANDITYPVTVTGGFVDVDGNGTFGTGDVQLTVPLRAAKGKVVTAVTTYLADNPTADEEQLKADWGVDDLYVLPSENKKIYKASEHFVGQMFAGTPLVGLDISGIDLTVDDSLTPEAFAKQQEALHKQQLITDGHATPFVENGFQLAIGHINDTHSHLESETMDLMFNNVETRTEVGGFSRVVTKLNEIKDNNDNVLILNAGDTFQGTLYYSLFKGQADSAMLNMLDWDALALGNHEFDDGDQHLADYLDSLTLDSSKVLAANITAPSGNPLENKWSNYTIKTFSNGEKVGIIGIDISGKTKNSSNPSDEIVFADELTTAQANIDELKSQGINKIVLLTHVGLDNDKSYASQLDGVDVIIGGDSHSLMGDFSSVGLTSHDNAYPFETRDLQGKKVCIAQAWQYSYIVGDLNIVFDENGDVKYCNGRPTLLVGETFLQKNGNGDRVAVSDEVKSKIELEIARNANLEIVTKDSATAEKLATFSEDVETQKATVIGTASQTLGHNRIPGDKKDGVNDLALGSDIAPIVAKSFYAAYKPADAAIQNAGGVRIAVNQGDVTMDTAYTLLPFANTLFEIKMTGSEIKQVLEDALTNYIDNGGSTGSFPYAYALRYDINTLADANSRISNLEIKNRENGTWSTVDLNNTTTMYTIVTNSYIAGGKDGYTTFKTVQDARGEGLDTFLDYAMSFVRYVEAKTAANETVAKLPAEDHPIKSFYNGGKVLFYSTSDGSFIDKVTVGALPDMVKFAPNGKTVVVANEGEPSDDYTYDPEGSVSIITLGDDNTVSAVSTLGFGDVTIPSDVRIKPNTTAVKDLEPEYVAINDAGTKAWITLQENNAVAMVDLTNKEITEVKSLGSIEIKDQKMDITNDGVANPITGNPDNIFALYQPDTIVSYSVGGNDYFVTANEGDDREYDAWEDYAKANKLDNPLSTALETALDGTDMEKLRVFVDMGLNSSNVHDELYVAGTRSFSIWDANGNRVFDSGSAFEEEIATNYAAYFNTRVDDSDDLSDATVPYTTIGSDYYFWEGVDARSLKKGVEPEALALATIGNKTFAYIGLEKQGGFFVYDITTPAYATLVEYKNDIDYTKAPDQAGDLAPEGMVTFTQDSKNYLAIANELSSTIAIYELASDGRATKLSSLNVGSFDKGAAEILDYSIADKKLFVTNGENKTVDIIDVSIPATPSKTGTVDFSAYADSVQSVSVKNGVLAIAVE